MMKHYLNKVVEGQNLTEAEAREAMDIITDGQAEESQIAAFLTALKIKGERPEEIAGFAQALLARADRVEHDGPVMCNCGTGGDTKGTFNVSTTVAFVLAAGGVKVAKHGNRGVSSSSGSADVLSALGVAVDQPAANVGQEIKEAGIGFLYAPALNKAMRFVAKTRRDLGFRTVFNLLGPIINPAGLDYQLVGIYDPRLTTKVAEVLNLIGVKHALVIHSRDGMDEISSHVPTKVSELKDGEIIEYELNPADFGLAQGQLEEYKGGSPEENARILRAILAGAEKGAKRDIVLINAAAGFYASGVVADIKSGIRLAEDLIDSGRALAKVEELIAVSRKLAC